MSRTSARRWPRPIPTTPRSTPPTPPPTPREIEALAAPIRERLAAIPPERRWLATSEGAFSYLTRDFELGEIYIWPINEDSTGTPQQIRRAIDLIRANDVPAIFSESTVDPRSAEQVARETGIAYGGVLYVDSLSEADGPVPTYLDLMRETTTRIAAGARPVTGLEVRGASVTYRTGLTALEDATFSLPEGSITALVGVNGSGKSTLFKAIMGFVPLRSGSVEILGLSRDEALKRNLVAYVPQAEEVDWTFPVLVEDVVMMGRYGHMGWLRRPSPKDRAMVADALERVGMAGLADRQIGELSGGQKKRVFLARALAQEGRVILLDEPFTGVDVTTEDAIVALLKDLRDEGRLMLISTHNLGSVPEFCDRAVLIDRRILASGPTATVFTQANLERAFGGKLRHFVLGGAALHDDADARQVTVLSDDERPFVIYDAGPDPEAKPGPNDDRAA